MLGYEGKDCKSCHVFDLSENKKTLGHGERGAETSKAQGTISSQVCLRTFLPSRAFRTNAEK